MLVKYITGLDDERFDELYGRVVEVFGSRRVKRGGPHDHLTLEDQLIATLMLLRHNMTEQMVAGIFGVSQATMSRIKDKIEPVIDEVLGLHQRGLEELVGNRPIVVDGTYVPTGNRTQTGRTNYSRKRGCQCVNVQIASDVGGTLLAVSVPSPGSRHDRKALQLCGWEQILLKADWIADLGYIGTNALTPIKKLAGQPRSRHDKDFNHTLAGIRSVIERCIAHWKNWKIVKTGYRRQLKRLPDTIQLVTRLELYRLGW